MVGVAEGAERGVRGESGGAEGRRMADRTAVEDACARGGQADNRSVATRSVRLPARATPELRTRAGEQLTGVTPPAEA